MSRHLHAPRDPELVDLFARLRRDESSRVPTFVPLSWYREEPESKSTRMLRLAFAGTAAAILTVAMAGTLVGWRAGLFPFRSAPTPAEGSRLVVRSYVPPPPAIERKQIVKKSVARRMPVPDDLSPPDIEIYRGVEATPSVIPHVAEAIVADAELPPPPAGPVLAGVSDVTNPSLIEASRVTPVYPEAARAARLEGNVILQVVVERDGTIGEAAVLRCSTPGLGFEEAALAAVSRWRYEPATQNGRPVATYATILVDYNLGQTASDEQDLGDMMNSGSTPGSESYAAIEENPFHLVADAPLSTFSIDVDTASYSNVRRFLNAGQRPPRDAVRVEELVNYFDYERPSPRGDDPFGVGVEISECPWNAQHRLARIVLGARRDTQRPVGRNLVFLIDVSGSMQPENKLPLVRSALGMLVERLDRRDTVAIVVYAGASGMVLPPTAGSDRAAILDALDRLEAGGPTAGADGLRLVYRLARENFIEGGVNRVILATDGDFNVGVTGHAELLRIIKDDARRGVYLTALGVGMGNYKDDRLEQLADRGNGNYAYLDTLGEARKVLVDEADATLVTVAGDVKLQVEFNPREVLSYRLIGYENRVLLDRDFNDDQRDAGDLGAGHEVTALYELVPARARARAGAGVGVPASTEVDDLRYQQRADFSAEAEGGELLTFKVRYKPLGSDVSTLRVYHVSDSVLALESASDDTRFAAAVAAFGMRLRQSATVRDFHWDDIERLGVGALGNDPYGRRVEFLDLVRQAGQLAP